MNTSLPNKQHDLKWISSILALGTLMDKEKLAEKIGGLEMAAQKAVKAFCEGIIA